MQTPVSDFHHCRCVCFQAMFAVGRKEESAHRDPTSAVDDGGWIMDGSQWLAFGSSSLHFHCRRPGLPPLLGQCPCPKHEWMKVVAWGSTTDRWANGKKQVEQCGSPTTREGWTDFPLGRVVVRAWPFFRSFVVHCCLPVCFLRVSLFHSGRTGFPLCILCAKPKAESNQIASPRLNIEPTSLLASHDQHPPDTGHGHACLGAHCQYWFPANLFPEHRTASSTSNT
jgi:hypothetical protein